MEGIVLGILGVIAAVAFLILVFGTVFFLLQVLWFSVPAWLAASAVFAVVFFGLSLALRPDKSTLVQAVSLNHNSLTWEFEPSAVTKAKRTILFSVIAGALAVATLVPVVFALHRGGRFSRVIWWWGILSDSMTVSSRAVSVMAFIFSFILVGIAVVVVMAYAEDSNLRATRQLVRVMNSDRGKADAYLKASARLDALVEELGIALDRPYTQNILEFCCTQKRKLAGQPWRIRPAIDDALGAVDEDLLHLSAANKLLEEVRSLLAETSRIVRKTGSMPLIVDLEDMYKGLDSEELATLLSRRQWDTHESVLEEMTRDLEQLRATAEKYHEAGVWKEEERRVDLGRGDMDEERACEILGVPVTATNDEIRKMYRHLAQLWHPDVGKASEDHQMRRIIQAYEYLREKRSR